MRKLWWVTPFLVVLALWLAYQYWLPSLMTFLDCKTDLTGSGTFGDSYGALNTLFAGLAFAGIIISIVLQSQELRETREELRGQKEQLERQAFENAFFQMLRLHNEIANSFKYRTPNPPQNLFEGKDCFAALRRDVKAFVADVNNGASVEDRYAKFYFLHAHSNLGHFFRNLYQIVKYVDRSDVKDKKFYTNIVRAQLSSDELYLLFYNALSSLGRERFFPLIVKFQFLEQLPYTKDIQHGDAIKFGKYAFGENPDWLQFLDQVPNAAA